MILALTSRNQDLAWLLESDYFKRLGVIHKAVDTGAELLHTATKLLPQVVIVNWELDDMDGFELCGRLRAQAKLVHTRVLVAVRKEHLSASVLRKAERVGAHNVLAYPLTNEALFQHLSKVLGLPRRLGQRISVSIEAEVEHAAGRHAGKITDLGIHGARMALEGVTDKKLSRMVNVTVDLKRHEKSRPITVEGKVVWRGRVTKGGTASVGLEFPSLPNLLRRQISELAFWELVPDSDPQIVLFMGDLTESTEFGDLLDEISGEVEFDVAGIRYINSPGLSSWVYFLDALRGVKSYSFSRLSPPFARQASMIPRMLGKGRVLSQFVPYYCEECGREELHLLKVKKDTDVEDLAESGFQCAACEHPLTLDDAPEKLFGYLRR